MCVCSRYVRVSVFNADAADAAAICASLFAISATAVVLGAALPLALNRRFMAIDSSECTYACVCMRALVGP